LNEAIDKAVPKFSASRANLVATADDLFMGATEMPLDILEARTLRHLNEHRCTSVGGVLFLNPVVPSGRPLECRHYSIANPKTTKPLPEEVVQGLRAMIAADGRQSSTTAPMAVIHRAALLM
jgi:hypothetical protein